MFTEPQRGETTNILVVGASGYAGRHIVEQAHRRGHRVRAVVRDKARAESAGAWGAPSLTNMVDEWAVGDVTDRSLTAGVCDGVDAVISALGVTRQKADPWDIDYRANLNILESARAHDVIRFCYVNAIHAESIRSQLTRAKTAFAQALIQSPLAHQVVSPSGYFSDMSSIAQMARRGRVYLLRPQGQVNPIHGADVAAYCLDKVESGQEGSYDIGGPEVLSWREVAQYAFEAVGRPAKITVIPPRLADGVMKGIGLIKPRVADTLSFMLWGLTHDCVGETTGTHRLLDFYRTQVQGL